MSPRSPRSRPAEFQPLNDEELAAALAGFIDVVELFILAPDVEPAEKAQVCRLLMETQEHIRREVELARRQKGARRAAAARTDPRVAAAVATSPHASDMTIAHRLLQREPGFARLSEDQQAARKEAKRKQVERARKRI